MNPDTPGHTELIVPRRPGPLRGLPSAGRRRGEIDEVLDEVFGPDEGGAGKGDLALIAGGLVALALGLGASVQALVWIGIAALALGCILPARDLLRSIDGRRTHGRDSAARRDGYPLRVEHPATVELVTEYRRLLDEAREVPLGGDAVEAGHLALIEVAGLLDGRDPVGAEIAYVAARRAAIAELRCAVREADAAARAAEESREIESRDAGVAAIERHDETAGDSLARMRALREVLDERG